MFKNFKKPFALLLILTLLIGGNRLYAQAALNIDGGGKGYMCHIAYGLIFFPKTLSEDKPDSTLIYCNGWTRICYLEGLQLSEKAFRKTGIKYKDVFNKWSTGTDQTRNTLYTYQYKNGDTTSCIETLNFFIHTYLPVILNGTELKQEGREAILKAIPPADIISIKRRYLLFRNSPVIRITTVNCGQ